MYQHVFITGLSIYNGIIIYYNFNATIQINIKRILLKKDIAGVTCNVLYHYTLQ